MSLVLVLAVCVALGLLAVRIVVTTVRQRLRSYWPIATAVPDTVVDPLLRLSVCELHRRLRSGELTSVQVVSAYIEHCKRVDPFIRAIVETRYDAALAEAAQADKELAALRLSGDEPSTDPIELADVLPSRWLLGIPCTIKECFAVTGMHQTSGLVKRRDFVATEDAPIVARLRAAGAIVIATTNVPEICMWYETFNKIYGTTCNPYDPSRIVGGSSGGEGAAAAAMMSPFGVGADIGGSIRMPAMFNGVAGLKASTRLVPNFGQYPCARSEGHFMLATGPMCRYAADVYPLLRTVAEGGPMLDPAAFPHCPMPRPPRALPQRLRIFLIEDLGFRFRRGPSVDQRRAVHDVADALGRASDGATVEILNFRHPERSSGPHASELLRLWSPMQDPMPLWLSRSNDPNEMKFIDAISVGRAGRMSPLLELAKACAGRSDFTLPVIALVIAEYIESALPKASLEKVRAKLARFSADVWRVLGDDGLIVAPTFPFVAPHHFAPQYDLRRWFDWLYTALFNALQGPAMSVPVWPTTRTEDPHLPCGVQIVGAWGRDELVLAAARQVERTLGGFRPPPWAR